MLDVIDGRRTVAIGLAISKSLKGSVGIACLTADLANSVASEAGVEGFSLWSDTWKIFDNIVVYIHNDCVEADKKLRAIDAIENLVARLSGPNGKVYCVM